MTGPTKDQELALCSPIKALMMLLVVLFHSCAMWKNGGWFATPQIEAPLVGLFAQWLNTFHVPVFVFISGYLYSYLKFETNRYGSTKTVLGKKVKRLLIPYVFICAIWAIPFWIYYFGSDKVVEKFILGGSPSQLWFILMLFVMFILFELITKLAGKSICNFNIGNIALMGSMYCFGIALGHFLPTNIVQIPATLQYAPLFWAGIVFRHTDTKEFWKRSPILFFLIHLVLFSIYLYVSSFEGAFYTVSRIAIWPFVRIAGIAMAISCCGKLFNSTIMTSYKKSRFLSLIENHSFSIYLFHQQIIWIIISILNTSGIPVPLFVIINFVTAVLLSLALSAALDKFIVTKFLLGR